MKTSCHNLSARSVDVGEELVLVAGSPEPVFVQAPQGGEGLVCFSVPGGLPDADDDLEYTADLDAVKEALAEPGSVPWPLNCRETGERADNG